MAKQLFKNYTFTFDKNEKKILSTFCSNILKQMADNESFYNEIRTFNSIVDKLKSADTEIKLSKDERIKLVFRLKENIEHMNKEIKKSGFIKRWFYKSAYKQYKNLLDVHFSN